MMAVHDYKCTQCGQVVEVHVSINVAPVALQSCDCGGIMKKVFRAPGIIFRGSGFYSTDSRK